MISNSKPQGPLFLIGGHDPSGAGIQADIETAAAFRIRVNSLVTALTVQNTQRVDKIGEVDADTLMKQLVCLSEEQAPHAVKIGLIPTKDIAFIFGKFLKTLSPKTPVIIDPVLKSGSNVSLVENNIGEFYMAELFPKATVVTPNLSEAITLTGSENLESASKMILESGCGSALVTDTEPSHHSIKSI